MELRLRQKKNGAGRCARATHMTANKATTASDLTPMTNNSNAQSSQIQKESQRGTKVFLEAMPTRTEDGWLYTASGMYSVSYKECMADIEKYGIFEGY